MKCSKCGKEFEFLPYKCKYCGKQFCGAHRLPEAHDCRNFAQVRHAARLKAVKPISKIESGCQNERELESELIKLENILREKVPSLLDPSLFEKTGKIVLPSQVDPFTEANLKNALWYALEECNIYGEVNLENGCGRIDLLCEPEPGFRIGIECKDFFYKNIDEEDLNYEKSSVLNALYFACFALEDYELSLDYIESKIKNEPPVLKELRNYTFSKSSHSQFGSNFEEIVRYKSQEEPKIHQKEKENLFKDLMEKYQGIIDFPSPSGVILYNPLGELWIAKKATPLRSHSFQTYFRTPEAIINYAVWKYFKNAGYIVATECKLPGASKIEPRDVTRKTRDLGWIRLPPWRYINGSVKTAVQTGHNTIDITALPKSSLNCAEPSKVKVIGVECKASIGSEKELIEQLKSYLNSGDLSQLYIAVPGNLEKKTLKLVSQKYLTGENDLSQVGILVLNDKNKIEIVREADTIGLTKMVTITIEKRSVEGGKFRNRLFYCLPP